jgi:hypothetical protein
MKKLTIFLFSVFCFSACAKAEYMEYYDFQTPLKMKKETSVYQPQSSLKPNKKEFIPPIETNTVKTHYQVNTDSMPKGIYNNNFVYSNGPMGGLRPTHVPSFDTQHVQF